jgi:hypothetical protein
MASFPRERGGAGVKNREMLPYACGCQKKKSKLGHNISVKYSHGGMGLALVERQYTLGLGPGLIPEKQDPEP